jgi:hypothetical protein
LKGTVVDPERDMVTVPADEWAVDVEQAERCVNLEAAIRAFFRTSFIDLSDPRIEDEDFGIPAMRTLRDLLGIIPRKPGTMPDWLDNSGMGPDGMADHPFEGWAAHEGLGPCMESKDWCHADCGLPPRLHHPYAHFTDPATGARVR